MKFKERYAYRIYLMYLYTQQYLYVQVTNEHSLVTLIGKGNTNLALWDVPTAPCFEGVQASRAFLGGTVTEFCCAAAQLCPEIGKEDFAFPQVSQKKNTFVHQVHQPNIVTRWHWQETWRDCWWQAEIQQVPLKGCFGCWIQAPRVCLHSRRTSISMRSKKEWKNYFSYFFIMKKFCPLWKHRLSSPPKSSVVRPRIRVESCLAMQASKSVPPAKSQKGCPKTGWFETTQLGLTFFDLETNQLFFS